MQRGTTLIEFALVFPILVALLFGMIDGGRFIAARTTLSQAAAVGVRTACLWSTTSATDVDTAVGRRRDDADGHQRRAARLRARRARLRGLPEGGRQQQSFSRSRYNFQSGFYKSFTKTMTQTSRMVCE